MVYQNGIAESTSHQNRKFLADAGYDGDKTRLQIVKRLKAVPFIPLNTRRSKGSTPEEKARRKVLCYLFYARNFIKNYWVDPDSEDSIRNLMQGYYRNRDFPLEKVR